MSDVNTSNPNTESSIVNRIDETTDTSPSSDVNRIDDETTAENAATNVENAATNAATNVENAATNAATNVENAATKAATNVATNVENAATKAATNVENAATNVATNVENAATKAATNVENLATNVENEATKAATKAATNVATNVENLAAKAEKEAKETLTKSVTGATENINGLQSVKNEFENEFKKMDELMNSSELEKFGLALNATSVFLKIMFRAIPQEAWGRTAHSIMTKVCQVVRDAETAGPNSNGITIEMEIVSKANDLIKTMIDKIDTEIFKQKIMAILETKMDEPLNDIVNDDVIAYMTMESLVSKQREDLVNFLFSCINYHIDTNTKYISCIKSDKIIDYITSTSSANGNRIEDETSNQVNIISAITEEVKSKFKGGNGDEKTPAGPYNNKEGDNTAESDEKNDNTAADEKNDNKEGDNTAAADEKNDNKEGDNTAADEKNDNKEGDNKDNTAASNVATTNSTVISPGTNMMPNNQLKLPTISNPFASLSNPMTSGLSSIASQTKSLTNSVKGSIKNAVGLVSDAAGEIWHSFDTLVENMITDIIADSQKTPPENEYLNKDALMKVILDGAEYHLQKPEGRQMYLRQFEPKIKKTIDDISSRDSIMVMLFKKCLNNSKVKGTFDTLINLIEKQKDNSSIDDITQSFGIKNDNVKNNIDDVTKPLTDSINKVTQPLTNAIKSATNKITGRVSRTNNKIENREIANSNIEIKLENNFLRNEMIAIDENNEKSIEESIGVFLDKLHEIIKALLLKNILPGSQMYHDLYKYKYDGSILPVIDSGTIEDKKIKDAKQVNIPDEIVNEYDNMDFDKIIKEVEEELGIVNENANRIDDDDGANRIDDDEEIQKEKEKEKEKQLKKLEKENPDRYDEYYKAIYAKERARKKIMFQNTIKQIKKNMIS